MKTTTILSALLSLSLVAGAAPDAAQSAQAVTRHRVCVNGEWEIAFAASEDGPLSAWAPARVPSIWGRRRQESWTYPKEVQTAKKAVYRLRCLVPESWRGSRVRLFIEQVEDRPVVSVNGREVWRKHCLGVCETVELADAVRFGETNDIEIATFAGGRAGVSGVSGDVFLESVPETSLDDVLIDTSVRKGAIGVRAHVSGAGLAQGKWTVDWAVAGANVALPSVAPDAATGDVSATASWKDPELWGYGEYGSPRFYWLRTRLLRDGRVVDVRYDRFGFREFWSEGDRFFFNGKPIFLRGDLYTRTRSHTDHPAAVAAYLQRMRASEMNFLRCHSTPLDNDVWFEAADELGFLVEPEMNRPYNGLAADSEEIRGIWRNYMRAKYNHPSLVMWCVDNESFSVGSATPENLAKIPPERVKAYDRLISSLRALDPNRIVEINHNFCLWPFVKSGAFSRENFMTFNIHPYGNLKKEIEEEIEKTGFRGEVPIVVGEIYVDIPVVDFVLNPRTAFAEQKRLGLSLESLLRSAIASKHVAGAIYCAQSGTGFFGFDEDGTLHFGPWNDFAQRVEGGRTNALDFCVAVPWPSLSGVGSKVERIPATKYNGGNFGLHVNWFDPSVPVFRFNVEDRRMRRPFAEMGALPPLPSVRPPEAVVRVAGGAGRIVSARLVSWPGQETSVMTDSRGTAWLRLPGPGTYAFDDGTTSRVVRVAARRVDPDKAGYDGLAWIDLGAPTAPVRAALAEPPAKEVTDVREAGEMLKNRSFDFADAAGFPVGWSVNDPANVATEPAGDDNARRLVVRGGRAYLTQRVRLQKGATYRIAGRAERRAGTGAPRVYVTTEGYKSLFSVAVCKDAANDSFDRVYTATGDEHYFYIDDRGCSADAEFAYDDFTIRRLETAASKGRLFDGGPFPLADDGTIRRWLVLGPFPNRGDEVDGYEAAKTDYLAADGGEAAYRPFNGRRATATFPPGFYWQAGTYELAWTTLSFDQAIGSLATVLLPEAMVSVVPPSNVAAYLACTILSPADRDATLGLGSDDGYVVWLNGQRVGAALENRGAALDQERYRVKLRKGENRLLVKAVQEGGGWHLAARLTGPGGRPIPGLMIRLDDEPSLLVNGAFASLDGWAASEGETNAVEGVRCLRLTGGGAQAVQDVVLQPGHRYRVAGFVRPATHGKVGVIGVRTRAYDWLLHLASQRLVDGWQGLMGTFVAPYGCRNAFFYCLNWYAGEGAQIDYADVRLVDLGESDAPVVVSKGEGREPRFVDGGAALAYRSEEADRPGWRRVDLATGLEREGEAPSARDAGGCRSVEVKPIHSGGTSNLRFVSKKTGRTLFETKAANGDMQIGGCHSAVVSEDGRYAVYVSAGIQPLADLVLVDLATGKTRQLTNDHAENASPALAPDLGHVAFVALADNKRVVKILKLDIPKENSKTNNKKEKAK